MLVMRNDPVGDVQPGAGQTKRDGLSHSRVIKMF